MRFWHIACIEVIIKTREFRREKTNLKIPEKTMYEILKKKNGGLKDQVLEFTREIVRIPSPSLKEALLAESVQRQMELLGYDRVFRDDFGNVVGVMFGREDGPTMLLCSHMDTVPPGNEDQWDRSPFSGEIQDGRLHGRGASDCKGGLAAQVFAGALLKRSLLPLKGNLIVAATVGEEIGGSVGVRRLVEDTLPELEISPTYAILGEPTDLGLYYGHDGWLELETEIAGSDKSEVTGVARAVFDEYRSRACSDCKSQSREEMATLEPVCKDQSTCYVATIVVERRLKDPNEVDAIVGRMNHEAGTVSELAKYQSVKVAVRQETETMYTGTQATVRRIVPPWETDPFSPLVERSREALAAAGCRVSPGKWRLAKLGMATAGGLLTREYDIPTLGYGPGNESVIHAPNEYVETDKVCEAVYGTAAIAHSMIGIPVFGWASDEI